MALPPATNNANDITSVIASLASRQSDRPKSEPLSGPKRAAVLMLALGEQYGGKVWSLLDDDEVRELSMVMSTLGTVEAEVVEGLGRDSRPATSPPPAAKASSAPVATTDVKKAVQNDVSTAREKQCTDAQERYKKLIEGRHIYKTGDNGERVYLSSQEIDEERVNAKKDIDDTCNSAT